MTKLHIITYATHNEGLYDELVNNRYGVKIKVLGWGDKWISFMEKVRICNEYVRKLDDNDIVMILDGFDTKVNKEVNKDDIIKFMENSGKKVIFSKNIENHMMGLERVVFDYCIDKYIANCGMYMGYVKYLNEVLDETLSMKCGDDQVNVNKLCGNFSFIGIDIKNEIFENLSSMSKHSNAMFVQYPGTISMNRVIRAIKEYTQFFINYLVILNIMIIIYLMKNKKRMGICVIIILNILLYTIMDTSCINCSN